MRISKHIHSCLLITDKGKSLLIDPGNYSYEEKGLSLDSIAKLDYLLITHEHADHFHLPFIKDILNKFPDIQILSNHSVGEILSKENIRTVNSIEGIEMTTYAHERVFGTNPPENVMFEVFDRLTHPGDSLSFNSTKEILALPVNAPWTSTTFAIEKAVELKPKVIIPIHDWHWNDKARNSFYERFKKYFDGFGIDFRSIQTGEEVEV